MANQDAILCHQTETKPMSHEFHVWCHLSCNFGFELATAALSLILKISETMTGCLTKMIKISCITKKVAMVETHFTFHT